MNDKTAIITGAGRGIARGVSQALASQGWQVAVCDIVAERAQDTGQEIAGAGGNVIAVETDIASEISVQKMVKQVHDKWGQIDLLVNAAGSYGQAFRPTHETPVDEWQNVIGSNLTGYFLCAKHVLPHMVAQGSGQIINFASNAGRSVSPLLGASYTAAKTGVIGLTRHLAHEYGQHGIRVNTIAPGPVNGERVSELIGDDQSQAQLAAQMPLGRLAETQDIVDVVLFMASDASRFMTGAILDVNGGYVLP